MEKRTMGAFMAALRKANGLTQQQVADKLNVSNKTVSKWECNEGYPEITMLPAIAELYSVSVDELLRGERIISSTAIESTTANEERVKYLITKTMTKFTNNSIISIVLGAVALVLAYTICDIVYDYNVLWIGYVIILILTGVSVAVAMVAFNNFLSGLRNEDIVEKDNIKENIKKSIKYITVISFLTLVTLLGLLCDVIMDGPSFLFVALPATAVAGGAISWFFRSFLYKKYDISDTGLSPQQKIYRKRHIKITSVILIVVLGLSLILPFIFAWHEVSEHSIYSYPEGVDYQYDSRAEAEREYYKLKDYVTGKKTLYFINDEYYSEETDEYVLYAEPLCDTFENNGNGYNRVSTELMPEEEFRFKNHTDMEKFKTENACDDLNQHNMQQRNLIFDDETLSVSYQSGTVSMTNSVGDIFPAFVLIGSCGFIVVFVISLAVYFKNKKKLQ